MSICITKTVGITANVTTMMDMFILMAINPIMTIYITTGIDLKLDSITDMNDRITTSVGTMIITMITITDFMGMKGITAMTNMVITGIWSITTPI